MAKRRRRYSLARRMGGGINLKEAKKAIAGAARMKAATVKARAKAGEMVETVLNAAVITGVSGGFGYWAGKAGGMPKLGPVPYDVGVAVGAHLLGLLGVGGKMDTHVKAVGNGALAAFGFRQGMGMAKGVGGWEIEGSYGDPSPVGSYQIEGGADYDDDDDDDVLEGMALDAEDFAGVEIL